jgi:hypothetical protein
MATFRCPQHDLVFQTETDHTKPGTRRTDSEGKETGEHRHPQWDGVSGHVDCPLCIKAQAAYRAVAFIKPKPEPKPEDY